MTCVLEHLESPVRILTEGKARLRLGAIGFAIDESVVLDLWSGFFGMGNQYGAPRMYKPFLLRLSGIFWETLASKLIRLCQKKSSSTALSAAVCGAGARSLGM